MYYRKSDSTYVNPGYHNLAGHRGLSLLRRTLDFDNGTMHARWSNGTSGPKYWVYSYSTPIAIYDPSDRTLYRIDHRYSVTTARHQGLLWELAHYEADYVVDCEPAWGSPDSAFACLTDAVRTYRPEVAA